MVVFFLMAPGSIHVSSPETSSQIAQAVPFSQVTLRVAPARTRHHEVTVETEGSATLAELSDNKPGMPLPRIRLCLCVW